MKTKNTRIANLQEMIALEEKRAAIFSQITAINERLSALQKELYGAVASRAFQPPEPKKLLKQRRKGRGQLKSEILEFLQAAGAEGASVKELAARLGVKPINVHSWFHANIKKIAGLKKIGAARFTFKGSAKMMKKLTEKPAKKIKVKKGKRRAKRGLLKEQILAALVKAGDKGVTIQDLATQLKTDPKKIYVWFAITGKRIPGIIKIGRAQYKMKAF